MVTEGDHLSRVGSAPDCTYVQLDRVKGDHIYPRIGDQGRLPDRVVFFPDIHV